MRPTKLLQSGQGDCRPAVSGPAPLRPGRHTGGAGKGPAHQPPADRRGGEGPSGPGPAASTGPPGTADPADERPVYTAQDIAGLLTDNEGFRLLVPQTEQQLGKKLRTADLQILAGLYDDLGMPADVIYLLVCHCVERARSQWGEGRRPTMRQVEKEGYRWAQLGYLTRILPRYT